MFYFLEDVYISSVGLFSHPIFWPNWCDDFCARIAGEETYAMLMTEVRPKDECPHFTCMHSRVTPF